MKDIPHQYHPLREFDTLRGYHIAALKVGWTITEDGYIGEFGRFGSRKGNGAKAMTQICYLADRHNMALSLVADSSPDNKLVHWYEQFGFSLVVGMVHPRRMMRKPLKVINMGSFRKKMAPMTDIDAYGQACWRHRREHREERI